MFNLHFSHGLPPLARSSAALVLALVLALMLSLGAGPLASEAAAQSDTWLVLPVEVQGQPSSAVDVASRVRTALGASGAGVVSPEAAAQVIRGELPPSHHDAPSELLDRLRQAARRLRAAQNVGNHELVTQEAGAILSDALPHIAAINRDEENAQRLADICGYLVEATSVAGDEASITMTAEYCLRLNPEILLDPSRHPLSARDRVDRAREAASAHLEVRLPGDAPLCAIRLNGVAIGLEISVPPGDYILQTECDELPGPWRRIHLNEGQNPVEVAPLELYARAEPEVLLSYAASTPTRLASDAAMLARLVTAAHAITVEQTIDGTVLRAFDVGEAGPGSPSGQTTVVTEGEASVGVGVRSLIGGDVGGGGGGSALGSAGIALAAVGGAAIIAGAVIGGLALADRQTLIDRCTPNGSRYQCPADQESLHAEMQTLSLAADGLLIGGGAVAVTGLLLVILDATSGDSSSSSSASLSCTGEGCIATYGGSF